MLKDEVVQSSVEGVYAEEKRAEEGLRESEEKFRNVFESANDCVIILDRSGRILDVNAKAVEVFGGSKEEVLGKHFIRLGVFFPTDIPTLMSNFANILAGKKAALNVRIKNKKGQEILLECLGSFMRIGDKLAGITVIARDVTERKKAEERLRASEERQKNLVELSPDGIVTFDTKGVITSCNTTATKMTGYSKNEIVGKHFSRLGFLRASDILKYLKLFSLAVLRGKVPKSLNVYCVRKDGTPYLAEVRFGLLREGGKTVGFQVIGTDITERKKTEEALRKSENKYRTLLENLPQKIFFKDKNSVYISCNGNYARDLKIKSDEIVGSTDYDFYPKELAEKYRADDKRIMESGKTEDIEEEYIQDVQKVFVHTVKTPVKDENGNVIGILGIFWDITERKRAEEELIRLSSAVKMSTDSIVISDLNGKIIEVNEASMKMYGTDDKGDLIGKSSFDLIAPEEREKAFAGMKEVLEKGYLKGREYHIVTKDGSRIPVDMSVSIMKVGVGKPIGFVGISRDITEREKMEERLKRQRDVAITLSGARNLTEALNRLFDNLLEIGEFDCAGFYLFAKETGTLDMIAHRGLSDKFVEKMSHYDADSPYTKVVLEGKPIFQKTCNFPPPIREDIQSSGILSVAAIPIQYEGEIIGHLNMASHSYDEISAPTRHVLESLSAQIGETIVRLRMEEKLQESEEKLRQYSEHLEELVQKRTEELLESEKRYSVLVEEASDGVAILQDGKIVFTNKRGPEIIGYSNDELMGFPFEKLVSEEYRQLTKERYERRLRGETIPSTYEIELIAKTGNRIQVELSATRIHYQGRPADLLVVRDIRERKEMEEQRLKLEKLAAIGELATMVGHDLRNPLQTITNAVYTLKTLSESEDSSYERNKKFLNLLPQPIAGKIRQAIEDGFQTRNKMTHVIDESVQYANKIVSDLQDFARPAEPKLTKVDLESLIQEALSDISIPRNVKVSIRHDKTQPKLYVDPTQIKRVFMNLTTNAIQAMPKGGELTISTSLQNGIASIAFQDTGVGIPKKDMEKLFTPFFTTRAKGMGMGLPVCKKFVEIHGGNIEVKSEVGKGTAVTVKLPILQENGR